VTFLSNPDVVAFLLAVSVATILTIPLWGDKP